MMAPDVPKWSITTWDRLPCMSYPTTFARLELRAYPSARSESRDRELLGKSEKAQKK
jgi:hypothetical protein